MGLFDVFRRRTPQAITNAVNSSLTMVGGNQVVYTHIDTEKAVSKGYNGNTAVYSILNKDAQKFGAIPSYVYKKGDETETVLENELSKLLNRPNEYEGQDAFRAKVRLYYKLTGEVFVWLNRGELGDMDDKARMKKPVLEMYVLPTEYMQIAPDPFNLWGVSGYYLDVSGTKIPFNKADIIHWKNTSVGFDPINRTHLRGVSPLSAGYKTLEQNNSATDSAVRMYQNDGAKGFLSNETLDKLTAEQKVTIKEVVDRKFNNNDVKGSVAALQGKWTYTNMGMSNTDLALLEGKNLSMKELCFLFDIPFELFDSETTFANKEQAQKGWITNSIGPACKQWDDECNRMLLPAFGLDKTAYIASDISDLPEMREDVAQLVTSLAAAWWLTPNQKLEWMGEEKRGSEFDEPFIPSGIVPLSMAGQSMDDIARQVGELEDDEE